VPVVARQDRAQGLESKNGSCVYSISRAHPSKAPRGVHSGPRGANSPRDVPVLATDGIRCESRLSLLELEPDIPSESEQVSSRLSTGGPLKLNLGGLT
jgi:hypothetical protein